jgi:hypothetical protein
VEPLLYSHENVSLVKAPFRYSLILLMTAAATKSDQFYENHTHQVIDDRCHPDQLGRGLG